MPSPRARLHGVAHEWYGLLVGVVPRQVGVERHKHVDHRPRAGTKNPGHTQCKGASRCKCRCKPQTLHPHLDAIKLLASASAVMQMQLSEPASASAVMQMQIELHLRCASKMQGPWQGPWVPHPGARGPAAHIFWRLRRGAWCLSERLVDCVGVGYSRTSTSIFIMGT